MADEAVNITELAAALGRTESAIRKWLKRGDWPFGLAPPWPLDAIREWAEGLAPDPSAESRAERRTGRPPDPEVAAQIRAERQAKLRLLKERGLKMALERRKAEGELVNAQERLEQELRALHALKAGLLELSRSLSARICEVTGYRDRHPVEVLIDRRVRELLDAFAQGWCGAGERPTASSSAKGAVGENVEVKG